MMKTIQHLVFSFASSGFYNIGALILKDWGKYVLFRKSLSFTKLSLAGL